MKSRAVRGSAFFMPCANAMWANAAPPNHSAFFLPHAYAQFSPKKVRVSLPRALWPAVGVLIRTVLFLVGGCDFFCRALTATDPYHIDICIFFSASPPRLLAARPGPCCCQYLDTTDLNFWHESCCKRSAGFQANIAPLKPRIR